MFRYVYPSHRDDIPEEVMDELLARLEQTRREPWSDGKITREFLLDPNGTYSLDVQEWGYRDARQEARKELRRREGHPADSGNTPVKPRRRKSEGPDSSTFDHSPLRYAGPLAAPPPEGRPPCPGPYEQEDLQLRPPQ